MSKHTGGKWSMDWMERDHCPTCEQKTKKPRVYTRIKADGVPAANGYLDGVTIGLWRWSQDGVLIARAPELMEQNGVLVEALRDVMEAWKYDAEQDGWDVTASGVYKRAKDALAKVED